MHNYGWNGSFYGGIQHTLPLKLRLSLNGGGSTPYISLQGKGSGYQYYGLSLNRSFLKEDRLSVNLYCNNIFEKYRSYNNHTEGANFVSKSSSKWPSRSFGVSVSYRIGELKASVKKAARTISNDDVKGGGGDYDAAVSIDADLQDDVNAIVEMVDYYNQGADVVFGVRRERKTDTFFKKHTAKMFYKLMRTMGGEIVYNHADFRLMSKRSLKALVSFPERNLFLRGMVCMLGYPTASVYYDRKERFAGESKYPFTKMLNFALDGITSFSVKPLRLITTSGLIFMLVSFLAIIYALVEFIGGDVIRGWTSLLISVWFIGGAILTAVGVIGEYIGKIYKEVKRRPRYLIEKEVNL